MCNEVFGVNTAEVEEQVRKLVETYKTHGDKVTLKEWGHKLNDHLHGNDALTAKFLKVLFEAKNDEFINIVLNEEVASEMPRNWKLIDYQEDLAYAWAVYKLPILQEVMTAIIDSLDEYPAYLNGCYALEDMMADIMDNGGFDEARCFQSYVAPYIVEYLDDYDLSNLLFLNDEGEVEDVDLDYLEYVWSQFCDTQLIEDILLDRYFYFMVNAVKEVLCHANI